MAEEGRKRQEMEEESDGWKRKARFGRDQDLNKTVNRRGKKEMSLNRREKRRQKKMKRMKTECARNKGLKNCSSTQEQERKEEKIWKHQVERSVIRKVRQKRQST